MTKRFQAIIFDLGSTLIYFDGIWPEVFAEADQALINYLQSRGLNLDEREFAKAFRTRLNEYYQQREAEFIEYTTAHQLKELLKSYGYPEVSDGTLRLGLEKLYAVSQAHWHAEEDAIPTLETLRQQGYRMGIVSNAGDDADVQKLVSQTDLTPYFDYVLSSAACGIRKPNPRIFEFALSHWGLLPDQAIMVGDTLGADILGARNAGIFSIWITRRADTPANQSHADTIHPDATIETLAELPVFLESLT